MRECLRFSLAALAILGFAAASRAEGDVGVGLSAPPIKVAKWLKGKPVDVSKGVNVVEFWATWCGPCKVSIPHLTELQKQYKGKVSFVGVSIWEVPEPKDDAYIKDVEAFVKEWGAKMDYTVAADGPDGTMARTWMAASEGNGIPTAFIVKDGKVMWIGHPMGGLDQALEQVIAGTFDLESAAKKDAQRRSSARVARETAAPINEAYKAKDWARVVSEVEKAVAKDPALEEQFGMAKLQALFKVDEAAACKYALDLARRVYWGEAMALNNIAWGIVDDEAKLKNPDLGIAVKIAERANELTKGEDPFVLDTLAYAVYKGGNLDRALELQAKAVKIAEGMEGFPAPTLKELRDRLDMFKAKKQGGKAGGG